RVSLRFLRRREGRAAEILRRSAHDLSGVRRRIVPARPDRARIPAQGQRLVRHRFPGREQGEAVGFVGRDRRREGVEDGSESRRRRHLRDQGERAGGRRLRLRRRHATGPTRPARAGAPRVRARLAPRTALDAARRSRMRKYLVTGLLIWIPLVITIWVLNLIVATMDQSLELLPEPLHPRAWLGHDIPGLGALLTVAVVLLTGLAA